MAVALFWVGTCLAAPFDHHLVLVETQVAKNQMAPEVRDIDDRYTMYIIAHLID